jgi:hypothetical protein
MFDEVSITRPSRISGRHDVFNATFMSGGHLRAEGTANRRESGTIAPRWRDAGQRLAIAQQRVHDDGTATGKWWQA